MASLFVRFKRSSSIVGSITLNDGRLPWVAPAYGASKAALNFLTRDYAKELQNEGFTVIALYPGVNSDETPNTDQWVKTQSAPSATGTVEESATAIVKLVFNLRLKDNGLFYSVRLCSDSADL
jgi:NAD(P)-dependent dehydrogenase (short-subunit alcohol dehydrogenase family)